MTGNNPGNEGPQTLTPLRFKPGVVARDHNLFRFTFAMMSARVEGMRRLYIRTGNVFLLFKTLHMCQQWHVEIPDWLSLSIDEIGGKLFDFVEGNKHASGGDIAKVMRLSSDGRGTEYAKYLQLVRDLDLASEVAVKLKQGSTLKAAYIEVATNSGFKENIVQKAFKDLEDVCMFELTVSLDPADP